MVRMSGTGRAGGEGHLRVHFMGLQSIKGTTRDNRWVVVWPTWDAEVFC